MEGNKAFILPAVAALVLLGLFLLRAQTNSEPEPAAPPDRTDPAPKGVKAQIREAITAAGDPMLDASANDAVRSALQPVVERCRSARPETAETPIKVSVEIIAAEGLGLRVERAEIQGAPPADLVGCIREGMLGSKPADIGKTGRLSSTLEYSTP